MGKKYVILSTIESIHDYWLWQGTPQRPTPSMRIYRYIVPLAGKLLWHKGTLYNASVFSSRLAATEAMADFLQIVGFQAGHKLGGYVKSVTSVVELIDHRVISTLSTAQEDNI